MGHGKNDSKAGSQVSKVPTLSNTSQLTQSAIASLPSRKVSIAPSGKKRGMGTVMSKMTLMSRYSGASSGGTKESVDSMGTRMDGASGGNNKKTRQGRSAELASLLTAKTFMSAMPGAKKGKLTRQASFAKLKRLDSFAPKLKRQDSFAPKQQQKNGKSSFSILEQIMGNKKKGPGGLETIKSKATSKSGKSSKKMSSGDCSSWTMDEGEEDDVVSMDTDTSVPSSQKSKKAGSPNPESKQTLVKSRIERGSLAPRAKKHGEDSVSANGGSFDLAGALGSSPESFASRSVHSKTSKMSKHSRMSRRTGMSQRSRQSRQSRQSRMSKQGGQDGSSSMASKLTAAMSKLQTAASQLSSIKSSRRSRSNSRRSKASHGARSSSAPPGSRLSRKGADRSRKTKLSPTLSAVSHSSASTMASLMSKVTDVINKAKSRIANADSAISGSKLSFRSRALSRRSMKSGKSRRSSRSGSRSRSRSRSRTKKGRSHTSVPWFRKAASQSNCSRPTSSQAMENDDTQLTGSSHGSLSRSHSRTRRSSRKSVGGQESQSKSSIMNELMGAIGNAEGEIQRMMREAQEAAANSNTESTRNSSTPEEILKKLEKLSSTSGHTRRSSKARSKNRVQASTLSSSTDNPGSISTSVPPSSGTDLTSAGHSAHNGSRSSRNPGASRRPERTKTSRESLAKSAARNRSKSVGSLPTHFKTDFSGFPTDTEGAPLLLDRKSRQSKPTIRPISNSMNLSNEGCSVGHSSFNGSGSSLLSSTWEFTQRNQRATGNSSELFGALDKQIRRVREIEECLLDSQQERARYMKEILEAQSGETDYLTKVRFQLKRLEALQGRFSEIYDKAATAKEKNVIKQLILTTAILSNKLLDSDWLSGGADKLRVMATELEATLSKLRTVD